jgi:hypothetical protein
MKSVLGKYRFKDESGFTNSSQISALQTKIETITEEISNIDKIIQEAEQKVVS